MFLHRLSVLAALLCVATPLLAGTPLPPDNAFAPPKIPQPSFSEKTFNVRDFGAKGDGTANDTAAISAAIEAASATPGGATVHFPPGKYMAASARLRSNVRLHLHDDAVIEGLKYGYLPPEPNPGLDRYQDFGHSHFQNSVLWGENVENFAITGGRVNGGGAITGDPKRPTTQPDGSLAWGGDKVITIKVGRNLSFTNLTHETGAHFVYLLNDCENVTLNKVVIKKSRDAVDLMGCRNVAVSECHFTGCSDDTIGVKSDYALGRRILTENVYVWDNYFESGCNGLQFGSETAGDFRNIFFWDITINRGWKSGIGITTNDSGNIENVHYKDITIRNAAVPIFILVTDRLRTGETGVKPGTIRNVTFQNIKVTEVVAGRHHGPANPATISGRPDSVIDGLTFDNVHITYKGGDNPDEANVTPPYPRERYQPNGLGPRPASGWYVRHARNLTFRDCSVTYESPAAKPSMVLHDVDAVTLNRTDLSKPATAQPLRATDANNLTIRACPGLPDSPATDGHGSR